VPFLDLATQTAELRGELDGAIAEILAAGRFVGGPAVETFERAFAVYCGASHAVGVASGTDAISLALTATGVQQGDEVITVANTTVATIAGIEGAGAVPVLVDADPLTWTLDPDALGAALTERTRAIVPVHLYGQCAEMEAILAFARRHALVVVEDAAQAHGAAYGGRRAGSLADAAAFSFYPTKNLGALGDAGAVVTSDGAVADHVRMLREYGERDRYESVVRGRNSRLDTLQAAVLSAKLPHLDAWNDRRRALADLYRGGLADLPIGLPVEDPARRHVYHLFVVRVQERTSLRRELAELGIETLVHYPRPVHRQPAYAALAREGMLRVSEQLCDEVVSFPLYPELRDADAEDVVSAIATVLSRTGAPW
jgi:dTDP-4-amino-4,6-dideoxygalactose transaminase